MGNRLRRALCIGLMAASILPTVKSALARTKEPVSQPVPRWQVDLGLFGYVERPRCLTDVSISFLTDELLLATFPTGDAHPSDASPPGDQCGGSLHAVVFDTHSGHVLTTRDLPATISTKQNSRIPLQSGLYRAAEGCFILRRGLGLELYSSDLVLLKTVTLPQYGARFENWDTFVSPTGHAFYALHSFIDGTETKSLRSLNQSGTTTFTYVADRIRRVKYKIDPDTLRVLLSWEDSRRVDTVADSTLAVADALDPDSDLAQSPVC